jgi:hypothetical protein
MMTNTMAITGGIRNQLKLRAILPLVVGDWGRLMVSDSIGCRTRRPVDPPLKLKAKL